MVRILYKTAGKTFIFSNFPNRTLEKHKVSLIFCAFSHFSYFAQPFPAKPPTSSTLWCVGLGKAAKNAKMHKISRKPYVFQGFGSENAKNVGFPKVFRALKQKHAGFLEVFIAPKLRTQSFPKVL